jgi:branched-chain amino acid transport system ATP-binding protein
MSKPRVLLLDEPSMGLAPLLVREIFKTLTVLNEQRGLTIFLIEQNARQALEIAHYAYVMENGKIALAGPSADLLNSHKVIEAYLGASRPS